jgi:D-beta-D-heptose 7-phosphate kinase/D-beta-D-heptose 1-phosphate adenosyltransferase
MEHLHDVIQLLENRWKGAHLLVVGDVMLDKYIWGVVERISPEAPIPVVRASHRSEQPGGAANVAMNIAGLGARATLAGFVGDDGEGTALVHKLHEAGIRSEFCITKNRPTTSKTRILGGRQQMLRLDVESTESVLDTSYSELIERVESMFEGSSEPVSAMVLSDYAKGVLTEPVCRKLIRMARDRGMPVLVDPKGKDFSRYRGATTICPNLAELALAIGTAAADMESTLRGGESLLLKLEVESLTVTLSERGIVLLDGKTRQHAAASAREVFDVSGAGDTVVAVLALCLSAGLERKASLHLANMAAGIVVSKVGTVPVQHFELMAALSGELGHSSSEKVLDHQQLLLRVAEWRAAGDRVVFTNGCFDLLHVGHIALLEQARREGDRLVVGLNSDSSVKRLKGSSRPVVGERERAMLLAALSAIDAVILFEEDTPFETILDLRPDVLVKGGDYTAETVVGAEEVHSWGGRVRIIPLVAGFSTTGLIARAGLPPPAAPEASQRLDESISVRAGYTEN